MKTNELINTLINCAVDYGMASKDDKTLIEVLSSVEKAKKDLLQHISKNKKKVKKHDPRTST